MINESEVREILQQNNPELKMELPDTKSVYRTIGCFAAYTKELIKQGNLPLIQKSFDTAEYLLKEGSRTVKLSIVNIYLYSITGFMHLSGAASRQVKEILTPALLNAYRTQIYANNP